MWIIVLIVAVAILGVLIYGIVKEIANESKAEVVAARNDYLDGYLAGFKTVSNDEIEVLTTKGNTPYRNGFFDGQQAAKDKNYSPAKAWATSEARALAVETTKIATIVVPA